MKHNWIRIFLYGCYLLLLAACNSAGAPTLPDETVARPAALPSAAATQVQSEKYQLTPSSGTQALVEQAKEDLAQRLSISTEQISLVEADAVVWPDASLGCPQLGIEYTQVTTPGYWILLEASGSQFPYHSDRGTQLFLCHQEESSPLFPVKPGEIDDGQPWIPP